MGTLRRLNIHRFRRVKPDTSVELADGFNVVLGRNATGKTTLLDLAVAADAFDFSKFESEPFDVSWEREGPEGRSRTRVVNHVEVVGEGTRTIATLDMEVEPAREGEQYQIQLGRTEAVLRAGGVTVATTPRFLSQPLALEAYELASVREGALDAHPRLAARPARLDESTRHLEDVLAAVVEGSRGLAQATTGLPEEVLAGFRKLYRSRELPGTKTFSFVDTPFLCDVATTLGFAGATLTFDLLDSRDGKVRYDKPRFLFTDDNGDVIRHDILSYGQKRMLSTLWYFASKAQLLACDELVNGLHHEWIAAALDRIRSRQALLTSQSPLLLDYLQFDSAEEVRRSFISCERKGGQLEWRNFTAEEAADFFSAYEVGIQRISDILVTRGLW